MKTGFHRGLIAAFVLVLAGCSATKLVYNKLDWFASWQLGKYVELSGTSEALFESGFESLWHWHRATQLILYVADLRELADAAAAPQSPAQVQAFLSRANAHAERVLNEALPAAVKVMQVLDDAQVAGLLTRMAEKRSERNEEQAGISEPERRERAEKNMLKSVKRWLGPLSSGQQEQLRAWVAARPDNSGLHLRYDEQWAEAFATILRARSQAGFAERLRGLLLAPELPDSAAAHEARIRDQQELNRLISELSGALSLKQRAHLAVELRALAQDLETLSREQ